MAPLSPLPDSRSTLLIPKSPSCFKASFKSIFPFSKIFELSLLRTIVSESEEKISKIIAKDLKKELIYFAGIDFIDQKLNGDINVTSPTGLKTLYDLSNLNLAKIFWGKLKL